MRRITSMTRKHLALTPDQELMESIHENQGPVDGIILTNQRPGCQTLTNQRHEWYYIDQSAARMEGTDQSEARMSVIDQSAARMLRTSSSYAASDV